MVLDKKLKKSDNGKYAILSQPWNFTFFENEILKLFLNHMVQNYQNEIAPIYYYGISTKTNEKYLKVPNLQPPDWKSPYWMTLYIIMLTCVSTASCCISWFCSAVMLPESLYCCSVCSTSACVLLPRARPSTRKLWSASSDWRQESTLVFTIEHGVLPGCHFTRERGT